MLEVGMLDLLNLLDLSASEGSASGRQGRQHHFLKKIHKLRIIRKLLAGPSAVLLCFCFMRHLE